MGFPPLFTHPSIILILDIPLMIYFIYLFGVCVELTEQVTIQVTLALCRILMVLFMVGSVLAAQAVGNDPYDDDNDDDYSKSE